MSRVLTDQKSDTLTLDGFVLDSRDRSRGIIFNLKDGPEKITSGIGSVLERVSDIATIELPMETGKALLTVRIRREERDEDKYGTPSFPGQYRGYWWCEITDAQWPEDANPQRAETSVQRETT